LHGQSGETFAGENIDEGPITEEYLEFLTDTINLFGDNPQGRQDMLTEASSAFDCFTLDLDCDSNLPEFSGDIPQELNYNIPCVACWHLFVQCSSLTLLQRH
jgi:hypothetical protein